jgi:hypothetical protein
MLNYEKHALTALLFPTSSFSNLVPTCEESLFEILILFNCFCVSTFNDFVIKTINGWLNRLQLRAVVKNSF